LHRSRPINSDKELRESSRFLRRSTRMKNGQQFVHNWVFVLLHKTTAAHSWRGPWTSSRYKLLQFYTLESNSKSLDMANPTRWSCTSLSSIVYTKNSIDGEEWAQNVHPLFLTAVDVCTQFTEISSDILLGLLLSPSFRLMTSFLRYHRQQISMEGPYRIEPQIQKASLSLVHSE
jgi:hypothetical protein